MTTAVEIAGFVVTLLVMFVGILGAVLPIIPGPGLIFVAAVGHRLCFGLHGAPIWLLCVLGLIAVLATLVDFGSSILGAKKFGATRWGMWGASLGGLAGMCLGWMAFLVGPFIGAATSEAIGGRDWKNAARAGAGATLGLMVGTAAKLVGAVTMVGGWAIFVLVRMIWP
ncbi:MAG TPA: DUF456 family protein [Candidatus Limnocylindria bacterium]|jgi:uncharacterized protein YqgC (DUF456 family)|nr:DUF456 family protein [Candidatus Limnocylindria bacterium]